MKRLLITLFLLSLNAGAMDNNNNNNNNNNNRPRHEFTAEELAHYLSNNLALFNDPNENYLHKFIINHIDGAAFYNANLPMLKDWGIIVLGHRLILYRLISDYNRNQNDNNGANNNNNGANNEDDNNDDEDNNNNNNN